MVNLIDFSKTSSMDPHPLTHGPYFRDLSRCRQTLRMLLFYNRSLLFLFNHLLLLISLLFLFPHRKLVSKRSVNDNPLLLLLQSQLSQLLLVLLRKLLLLRNPLLKLLPRRELVPDVLSPILEHLVLAVRLPIGVDQGESVRHAALFPFLPHLVGLLPLQLPLLRGQFCVLTRQDPFLEIVGLLLPVVLLSLDGQIEE